MKKVTFNSKMVHANLSIRIRAYERPLERSHTKSFFTKKKPLHKITRALLDAKLLVQVDLGSRVKYLQKARMSHLLRVVLMLMTVSVR